MTIEIIEHINLDEYVYREDIELFARIYLDDKPTRYAISDHGRCWSECRGGRFLTPNKTPNGYIQFPLRPKAKWSVNQSAHRLVARAFCKQDDPSQEQVDHKNGNRTDNRACNLHWVTQSENQKRRFTVFQQKAHNVCRIFAYSVVNKTVQYFDSITDASIKLGLNRADISCVCNHHRTSSGGYFFGRAEEFDKDKLDARIDRGDFSNVRRRVIHILQDGTTEEFLSQVDACRKTGINQSTLSAWLRGRNTPSDGSAWKYTDEPYGPRSIVC